MTTKNRPTHGSKTKNCSDCGESLASWLLVCPPCGAELVADPCRERIQRVMARRKTWSWVLGILAFVLAYAVALLQEADFQDAPGPYLVCVAAAVGVAISYALLHRMLYPGNALHV